MLGREAVVDGDDLATRLVGERAAQRIMRLEIADHPAAAMEIDQCRHRAAGCDRGIDANGDLPLGSGNGPVFDLADRNALQIHRLRHRAIHLAAFGRRQIDQARRGRIGGQRIEDRFRLWIE